MLGSCHPGYQLNKNTQKCECDISDKDVVRCDGLGRYVYIRVSSVQIIAYRLHVGMQLHIRTIGFMQHYWSLYVN